MRISAFRNEKTKTGQWLSFLPKYSNQSEWENPRGYWTKATKPNDEYSFALAIFELRKVMRKM